MSAPRTLAKTCQTKYPTGVVSVPPPLKSLRRAEQGGVWEKGPKGGGMLEGLEVTKGQIDGSGTPPIPGP